MEQSQLDEVDLSHGIRKSIYYRLERVIVRLDNKLWTRCEKKFNGTPQRITVLSEISWQVEHPVCERLSNTTFEKTSSYVYGK